MKEDGLKINVKEKSEEKKEAERLNETYLGGEEKSRNERLQILLAEKEGEEMKISEQDLQEVYKNTSTGRDSVDILRSFSGNKGFKNILIRQYKEYASLGKEIEMYANKLGYDLQKNSFLAKSMMYVTTAVNTIKDKSDSKLAEIMIQGIDMGIIAMTKLINKNSDEDKTCSFAESLLALLQKNLEEM
ncbi:MAG: hypothetical protein IJ676_02450, partial [Clostridia bacterium]|nr:hypothetical protein [Clostridia bacterium]